MKAFPSNPPDQTKTKLQQNTSAPAKERERKKKCQEKLPARGEPHYVLVCVYGISGIKVWRTATSPLGIRDGAA